MLPVGGHLGLKQGERELGSRTLKRASSASFAASVRMVLTSSGVKDVPPPLGKSISSVTRVLGFSTSAFFVLGFSEVLVFLCFRPELTSSKGRFVAAIVSVPPTYGTVAKRVSTTAAGESRTKVFKISIFCVVMIGRRISDPRLMSALSLVTSVRFLRCPVNSFLSLRLRTYNGYVALVIL